MKRTTECLAHRTARLVAGFTAAFLIAASAVGQLAQQQAPSNAASPASASGDVAASSASQQVQTLNWWNRDIVVFRSTTARCRPRCGYATGWNGLNVPGIGW